MTGGRVALAVLLSLVFPGFGQGLSERRAKMVGFAVADLVVTVGVLMSVWALAASVVVRLVAAGDAFVSARRYDGRREGTWGLAAVAVAIGLVGIAFANYAIEGFEIPSSSMVSTLAIDDQVYVDKLSLRWKKPERGEVLVFIQPCAKRPYVKRVIALAGDTVEVRCGVPYVNGKAAERVAQAGRFRETLDGRSYVVMADETHDFPAHDVMIAPSCVAGNFYDTPIGDQPKGKLVETKARSSASTCEPQVHFVVPAKSLFVLGDNRGNANDSRFWGVVPEKALIGRVIGVYSPWSRFGAIR